MQNQQKYNAIIEKHINIKNLDQVIVFIKYSKPFLYLILCEIEVRMIN